MKEITHNQARRYMQADLDGLLSDAQRLDLESHLDSCPACRAESESFSTLTSRLRSEFHERWDAHNGPSQHVTANVRSQTRRIIMSNKVKWGLGALGGAVALVLLGLGLNFLFSQMQGRSVAANETTVPDDNNLHVSAAQVDGQWIAFQMEKDGNMDIYAIRTDGSALTNLTDNPGSDASSVWSPDGTRIAFVSDRDGNENIYVMNMDGSGLTRLTDDPGSDTAPLWSPDGRKLAYQSRDLNANFTNIFVVDSNGQNRHKLTNDIPGAVFPSEWSQDGKFIFTNIDYQIVKINIDTGNIIPLAVAGQFTVSADGSQILHLVGCGENSAEFCNIVKTVHIDGTNEETHSSMEIKQVCSSPEVTNGHYYMTKWSPDRNKILFAFYCEKNGGSFYIANADGSNFRSLANYPILGNGGGFDWSPDSHSIIFTSSFDGEDDGLYILNITEILQNPALRPARLHPTVTNPLFPSWQPVMQEDALVEEDSINIEQSPNANNRLLAFTMERNGNTDVYTVRADGSDLTNLTGDSNGSNPYWSPDGRRIAFNRDVGDRSQVFVMDADGSNVVQLTDDGDFNKLVAFEEGRDSDFSAWSPDGSKLVFVKLNYEQTNNEEWMRFYVLDVATKTQTPLTPEWGAYQSPAWSPDGEHVAFTSFSRFNEQGEPTRLSIHVVDADGNNLVDLTESLPDNVFSFFHRWSSDGGSVIFSASNQAQDSMRVYEARLDGSLTELSEPIRASVIDWWNGTALAVDLRDKAFQWLRPDGTSSILTVCPPESDPSRYSSARSKAGTLFFGVRCAPGEWRLYLANEDGTTVQELVNPPLSTGDGSMADQAWSPDGNFIAFNVSSSSHGIEMFILDVAATLDDPSLEPVWFNVGEIFSSTDSISWQPVITEETLAERPPQPYEGLVAFTSAVENGDLDIYTMRPDGSGLTNLTKDPARDVDPYWSPDGKRIAFLSDRAGYLQVFTMNADGSDVFQVTRREADHEFAGADPWSPDGSKLAFLERSPDGKQIIYTIDANGWSGLPLVYPPGNYSSLSWSPDGGHIAYIVFSEDAELQLHVTSADGDGTVILTDALPEGEVLYSAKYTWTRNGRAVSFVVHNHIDEGQDQWIAYEAEVNSGRLVAKAASSTPMHSWWNGTAFVQSFTGETLTWLRDDGTYSEFKPFENCQMGRDFQGGSFPRRSPNGYLLYAAGCPNGDVWLYWANPDGTEVRQLSASPPNAADGGLNGIFWSPADRFAALNVSASGITSLHLLDVESGSVLTTVPIGGGDLFYNISWQPMP